VLLLDQELHQALDIGSLPLEVALGIVCGSNIGCEEEGACVGERPVFRDGVFGGGLEGLVDFLERAVLADESQGGGGTDAFDGVDVVAAEEDAEVDELWLTVRCTHYPRGSEHTCSRFMSKPSSTLSR
jgi:hypothetical protein